MTRRLLAVAALVVTIVACSNEADPELLVDLTGRPPGEIVALRADGEAIEWIERTAGRILRRDADGSTAEVAAAAVSVEGEQRGLLGHVVLDGRRFAAWTEPDSLRLVVGELRDDGSVRPVWEGTTTERRAVGGHLEAFDGQLLLGLGELTGWARDHGSGALVTLDPDGPVEQEPEVVSDGWNNPFAFVVDDDGTILVADNPPAGGSERLAAIDGGDSTVTDLPAPERAPSAIALLDDGRIVVCGFLDSELRAYERDVEGFVRVGTPGECLTGVTVTDSGRTIVATAEGIVALP